MKPALLMAALAALALMLAPFALESLFAPASADKQIMTVEQAFTVSQHRQGDVLQLNIEIAPGAYLYRDKLRLTPENLTLGEWQLPAGEPHEDEYFGKSRIFREPLTLTLPLQNSAPNSRLTLSYQGCGTGFCYPPRQQVLELN